MDLWVNSLGFFLVGAVCGGLVVYWTMKAAQPSQRGDTRMTSQQRDRSKVAVAIIGMAVILVVFGLQVRDKNARDADYRAQQTAFRAQQTCLAKASLALGHYLTNTLNRRVQANDKLDRAQKGLTRAGSALSAANTEVVLVVAGGFDNPPTSSRQDLVHALAKFRDLSHVLDRAARRYARVEKATRAELDTGTPSKPYDPPKVTCVP